MVDTATPWIVRTTKRQTPSSAPNPRKKRKVSTDADELPTSATRRKPRQQTLTQIQFVPRHVDESEDDELEPIATTVPRRSGSRKQRGRLQKSNSTLTQMDFLAPVAADGEDDGLDLQDMEEIGDSAENGEKIFQLDGSRDTEVQSTRKRNRKATKPGSKTKDTLLVKKESQGYQPLTKKRRLSIDEGAAAGSVRRSSRRLASVRSTRSTDVTPTLHEDGSEKHSDSLERPRRRVKKAKTEVTSQDQLQDHEGHLQAVTSRRDQDITKFVPETPSKKRNVIPSSQSPESLPPSARKYPESITAKFKALLERSPLKERSTNVQIPSQRSGQKKGLFSDINGSSSQKRKACTLKPPELSLAQSRRKAETEEQENTPKRTIWSPPSSSPPRDAIQKPPAAPPLEIMDSVQEEGSEINPEGVPATAGLEIQDSLEETEPEIPETSQFDNERATISPQSATETQGTLRSLDNLLGLHRAPTEPLLPQPGAWNGEPEHSEVVIRDFGAVDIEVTAIPPQSAHTETMLPGPIDALSDASSDEDEGSIMALSPGSSIANDTQFNAELAARLPTSSANPSRSTPSTPCSHRSFSPSTQLDRDMETSLLRPRLVHQPSTHSSTTKVPLNDTSSPTLPSRSTQRIVYPASLPRPSQVSTQDPTQQYLPMSSLPLQPWSSPPRNYAAPITIKDSSSMPLVPLHEIPSQRHEQSQSQSQPPHPRIDLGLDDCLDSDSSDTEMLAAPDHAERELVEDSQGEDEDEESQVVVVPTTTTTTPQTTRPARKSHMLSIAPEVRALLSESMLESVPGPPGWSQTSWDDELL